MAQLVRFVVHTDNASLQREINGLRTPAGKQHLERKLKQLFEQLSIEPEPKVQVTVLSVDLTPIRG